jgi:hypothetical protein
MANIGVTREQLVTELVESFEQQQLVVHAAKLPNFPPPPAIQNSGFGDGQSRTPDVIGVDRENQRIVFGIIREDKIRLANEDSLTEYNVLLDHKENRGAQASHLCVLIPPSLQQEFTSVITHYIHREYWHRILPLLSRLLT